jgi:hypothetical protein
MIPRTVVTKMEQPLCLKITSILKKITRIATSTAHYYKRAVILLLRVNSGGRRCNTEGGKHEATTWWQN